MEDIRNIKVTYSQIQIEEVLQIINSLPFSGIQNAEKIFRAYMILNRPFIENEKTK